MKKLLFVTFLLFFTFSFAQNNEVNEEKSTLKENLPPTITAVSAYPNPLISRTKINFKSTQEQTIEFSIKNLLGKVVYLEKINARVGYNSIPFTRNNLGKGMYIYALQTDTEVVLKRLVIK